MALESLLGTYHVVFMRFTVVHMESCLTTFAFIAVGPGGRVRKLDPSDDRPQILPGLQMVTPDAIKPPCLISILAPTSKTRCSGEGKTTLPS